MAVSGARRRRRIPYRTLLVAFIIAAVGLLSYKIIPKVVHRRVAEAQPSQPVPEVQAASPSLPAGDRVYTVQEGDTLSDVFKDTEVPYNEVVLMEQASRDIFDLTRIQVGKEVHFNFAPADAPYKLADVWYMPDEERIVHASQTISGWAVVVDKIAFEKRMNAKKGTVDVSLYQSAMDAGLPEALIIDFADQFAWDIDFARDTRSGDSYKVVYEEKWRDGSFVKPGRILAAEYVNNGHTHQAYYYTPADAEKGAYFNEKGESLQKAFLKVPVNFRYISSGYTMARFHPILGKVTPHQGIDYAAAYGAPIIAIGDGVVSGMGWETGYGNRIHIRHNERYSSQYGHMSAYVKGMNVGDHVSQGQVIGYVGSTGWSTGNHVHFSITEYGNYIDPAAVEAPEGKPVPAADMDAYKDLVAELSKQMQEIP